MILASPMRISAAMLCVRARDGEDDEKARGGTKTRSSVRPLASLGARDENGQEPVS